VASATDSVAGGPCVAVGGFTRIITRGKYGECRARPTKVCSFRFHRWSTDPQERRGTSRGHTRVYPRICTRARRPVKMAGQCARNRSPVQRQQDNGWSQVPPLVDRSPGAPWHQPGPHSGVPKNLHTREVTCEDGRSVCSKPLSCSETTIQRMESVVATTICFFRRGT